MLASGCVECTTNQDCPVVEVCQDGGCVGAPRSDLALVAPTEQVGATFSLVLDASFSGAFAILHIKRHPAESGDPCLPFFDRELLVPGSATFTTTRVTVPDLPSLGRTFSLRVTLQTTSGQPVTKTFTFRGDEPSEQTGGASIQQPSGVIDVDENPLAVLAAIVDGPAFAFVAPLHAPPTPRFSLAERAGTVDAIVPLVRGPQVIWVETTTAQGIRRCGSAVVGVPEGDDGGLLDITLVATAAAPALVGLSLRASTGDEEVRCGATETPAATCLIERTANRPSVLVTEQIRLRIDAGIVDIAAVPRAAVGPVQGLVRVTLGGQHRGFFGPFTFFPDEGQSWKAGALVIDGGDLVGLLRSDELVVGAPW